MEKDAFYVFYGDWIEKDFMELWRESSYTPHPSVEKLQNRIDKASIVTDDDIERAKKELGVQ